VSELSSESIGLVPLPDGVIVREFPGSGNGQAERLIGELSESGFSGYVRVAGLAGQAGHLFFSGGLLHGAVLRSPPHATSGLSAAKGILELAQQTAVQISVALLNAELMASHSALVSGQIVQRGISAQQFEQGGLLGKLRQESFTGCIRVESPDTQERGYGFLFEGKHLGGYVGSGERLTGGSSGFYPMTSVAGATIDVLQSPSPRNLVAGAMVTSLEAERLAPLLAAASRAIAAIEGWAGKGKARSFFDEVLGEAAQAHPWVGQLRLEDDGQVRAVGPEIGLTQIAEIVSGFVDVLNGLWTRGGDLVGVKLVSTNFEEKLQDLRILLGKLGFPEAWPPK